MLTKFNRSGSKGFRLLHNNPEDVVAMVVEPKVETEPEKPVEAAPAEGAAPAAEAPKKEEKK